MKVEHFDAWFQPSNAMLLHLLYDPVNGARLGTWPMPRNWEGPGNIAGIVLKLGACVHAYKLPAFEWLVILRVM